MKQNEVIYLSSWVCSIFFSITTIIFTVVFIYEINNSDQIFELIFVFSTFTTLSVIILVWISYRMDFLDKLSQQSHEEGCAELNLPDWLPVKQYDGFKIIHALQDIGIVNMFWDSPEERQIQVQIDMVSDNGISVESLTFLKQKFQCNSLEVRTFFDTDQDKDRTVIELIYREDEEVA